MGGSPLVADIPPVRGLRRRGAARAQSVAYSMIVMVDASGLRITTWPAAVPWSRQPPWPAASTIRPDLHSANVNQLTRKGRLALP